MAYPPKSSVEPIDSVSSAKGEDGTESKGSKGPPPAFPKPRPATGDSSLYSSAGRSALMEGETGLGAEGSNPSLVGVQGLALVQRGIQLLSLAFPENPGLGAVLADLTGRLQVMVPQLVSQSADPGMGLLTGMLSPMGAGGGMGGGMPGGMPPGVGGGAMPPAGPMAPPPSPMGSPMGGPMPPTAGPPPPLR